MGKFIKDNALAVAAVVAVLAFVVGRMSGAKAAAADIQAKVTKLIQEGRITEALAALGAGPAKLPSGTKE